MEQGSFRFKKFSISHDKCAMKVGTDGVLLGAWCTAEGAGRVLDIGTGSGLIAIMLAQRNPGCLIEGVEIDGSSFSQATENAAYCPWTDRIKIHNACFNDFHKNCTHVYDLIVSNPPFFLKSLSSPLPSRTTARHALSLSPANLINGVTRLLSPEGIFSVILPVAEAEFFTGEAVKRNLYTKRITEVLPNPGKPPKRLLLEFTRQEGAVQKSVLTVEMDRRHQYSDEFKRLTEEFYLYFLM